METEPRRAILIVDDYPANLVALGAVLEDPAYELLEATSGTEALEILRTREVALVILDVQMPGMDGYEVAREMRKDPHTRDVPIIFLTAVYREDPQVKKGYLAGGQDYLGKPFDPEVLRAKVEVYSSMFQRTTEAHRQAERLRRVWDSIEEIVATVNAQGEIVSLNPAFERVTGTHCEARVGRPFVDLLSGDLGPVRAALVVRDASLIGAELKRAAGAATPVEISIQPLVGESGSVAVIRDVSSRRP